MKLSHILGAAFALGLAIPGLSQTHDHHSQKEKTSKTKPDAQPEAAGADTPEPAAMGHRKGEKKKECGCHKKYLGGHGFLGGKKKKKKKKKRKEKKKKKKTKKKKKIKNKNFFVPGGFFLVRTTGGSVGGGWPGPGRGSRARSEHSRREHPSDDRGRLDVTRDPAAHRVPDGHICRDCVDARGCRHLRGAVVLGCTAPPGYVFPSRGRRVSVGDEIEGLGWEVRDDPGGFRLVPR